MKTAGNYIVFLPNIDYNVICGIFATGIDHWAHIGGFISGFLLGKALDVYLEIDNKTRKKVFAILSTPASIHPAFVIYITTRINMTNIL